MVLTDIEFIRGEHLVSPAKAIPLTEVHYNFNDLLSDYPDASQVELVATPQGAQYHFKMQGQLMALDALGRHIEMTPKADAIRAAKQRYTGEGDVIDAQLFETLPPQEVSPRLAPVWQVNFDDAAHTSLYISAITGELSSKRHDYWRIFDWMWMLHIMDYDTRENVNNRLLSVLTLLSLITALGGLALTYISFRVPKEA